MFEAARSYGLISESCRGCVVGEYVLSYGNEDLYTLKVFRGGGPKARMTDRLFSLF